MNKVSYILGASCAENLLRSGVVSIDFDDFLTGIKDIFQGNELRIPVEEGNQIITEYFENLKKEQDELARKESEDNKKKGEAYLKVNEKKDGVEVTSSGLQYKVITKADGEVKHPDAHSRVKCHYEGRLIDGRIFDSSYMRNEPAVFGLDQVIPGWTEGLQLMGIGEKYEFTIPADLAYGDVGIPGRIPGNSVLIFTVELLEIL